MFNEVLFHLRVGHFWFEVEFLSKVLYLLQYGLAVMALLRQFLQVSKRNGEKLEQYLPVLLCMCIINIFDHCPQDLVTGGEILLRNVKLGDASFSVADRLLKIPPSVRLCGTTRGPLDGF